MSQSKKQKEFIERLAHLMSEFNVNEMQVIYTMDDNLGINCLVKEDSELKGFFVELTDVIARNFAAEFAGGVEMVRKREEIRVTSNKTKMN